jgi:hypothetical protein
MYVFILILRYVYIILYWENLNILQIYLYNINIYFDLNSYKFQVNLIIYLLFIKSKKYLFI